MILIYDAIKLLNLLKIQLQRKFFDIERFKTKFETLTI